MRPCSLAATAAVAPAGRRSPKIAPGPGPWPVLCLATAVPGRAEGTTAAYRRVSRTTVVLWCGRTTTYVVRVRVRTMYELVRRTAPPPPPPRPPPPPPRRRRRQPGSPASSARVGGRGRHLTPRPSCPYHTLPAERYMALLTQEESQQRRQPLRQEQPAAQGRG
jgi:hypothetical protein